MNEETKPVLRNIIEELAWRQIASFNMLGHCLKFVRDLGNKLRVVSELDLGLRLFREVGQLYGELGWKDIESVVRDRLDGFPYPESRFEFGVAYFVCGLAEQVSMESYVESECSEFAAIARSYVHAAPQRPEPTRFVEFARDATNRPLAQQYLNRWLGFAVSSFGETRDEGSDRAVELGLRSRSSMQMQREFLDRLEPFLTRCGLSMPEAVGSEREQFRA